ncbi:uncharacterized protein LOC135690864 [Rhopilema esculentum]|uniref:uncharacterized protein LOC135690864 n=1 Tax=Rhopilema esculentum TaxID=499914 RepID=UPI0031CF668C|eukprot:gene1541-15990_t
MAEGNAPCVLVTGASGFVANHCIKKLLEDGEFRVKGTVRSLSNETVCEALRNLVPDAKYPLQLVQADLLDEGSWKGAVEGCTYVLHVASPFFTETPKHEDEFIKPAVDGTLNVLKACKEVGGVKRVVLTSSMAAIFVGNLKKELDEGDWSDVKKANAYEKSKCLAEKAAWDFVKELPDESKFELVAINPGFIIGPLLMKKECASFKTIKQLLVREMSAVPDLRIAIVDVRDVAEAHVKSITNPDAAGNRHILSAGNNSYSFLQLADSLAKEFNSKGFNVPTKKAPKPLLWFFSWFNKDLKASYPYIGVAWKMNNSRMKNVLGIEGRDINEAVVAMAQSMIDLGMVQKPPEKIPGGGATGKSAETASNEGKKDGDSTGEAKGKEDGGEVEEKKEEGKEDNGKEEEGKVDDAKEEEGKVDDEKEEEGKVDDEKEEEGKVDDEKEEEGKEVKGEKEEEEGREDIEKEGESQDAEEKKDDKEDKQNEK